MEKARRFVTRKEMKVERLPWGPYDWLVRPDLVDTQELLLVRVHMPRGKGHTFHRHPGMEKIIYVLEGRAEQWVGAERRILGPGEVAHIPKNEVHATYNVGNGVLRLLVVLGPARFKGRALVDVSQEEPWASIRLPRTARRPRKASKKSRPVQKVKGAAKRVKKGVKKAAAKKTKG